MKLSTLTESEFQDQVQFGKDLKDWLYQIGIQPTYSLFYKEEKQESTRIGGLVPERDTINNPYPDRDKPI